MISLLKIPNTIARDVLRKETSAYLAEYGLTYISDKGLDNEFSIEGYEYYHIYKGTTKIGFINGFKQDIYWFANRVYIQPIYRRYFKASIDCLDSLVKQYGLKGIIVHPDKYTANLYNKHNIAKEI